MSIDVIVADDPKWMHILQQTECDFYHTSDYHMVHEYKTTDKARLIVYQEGNNIVALPLLLRPLRDVEGLSENLNQYYDATSVYGYAGPITNHQQAGMNFFLRFGQALSEVLQELKIISVFSRLHPILNNDAFIFIGDKTSLSATISIDLTQPEEVQVREYRKSHRYDIKKARRDGVESYQDIDWEHYDDFQRLYIATMKRVNADSSYFFDSHYFNNLRTLLGPVLQLFVVKLNEVVLSAGLFTNFNGILQYHLGASNPAGLKNAGNKILLDSVRQWGTTIGSKVFHLGGGFGAEKDGLFLFKAGFSDRRHPFKIWKHVVNQDKYDRAVEYRNDWLSSQQRIISQPNFFPLYRAPTVVKKVE